MLDSQKFYSLFSPNQKIYTKVKNEEPTYYAVGSKVSNSQFASGSIVEGEVIDSVISRNTRVNKGSSVKSSILFPRVLIGENAVVENAILDNIIFDDKTENFRIHCPEQGAFVAYKKGLDNLIIKLLIPSDAKRVSSTMNCCRCDKAKVLEIKNFEGTKFFDEAWSTVAENFCYKLGEWVYAENFNEDRWYDSTGGIHFWMTEEEAKAY